MNVPIQKPPTTASPKSAAGVIALPASAPAVAPGSAELPQQPEHPFSAFGSLNQFKDAQRMATLLAHSSIVPENYQGDEHLGNCVIALEIANRIGASILAVMQNLRLIEGKPAWSSQFLISCVNASKRFSPLRYQMTGTPGADSWGCIAWAIDKTGERLKSPEVTIGIAKAEGWYDRLGSKWKSLPELMLCYRSATLFTRLYAPEITMGIQTTEELMDMGPERNGQTHRPMFESPPSSQKAPPDPKAQPQQTLPISLPPSQGPAGPQADEPPSSHSAAGQVLIAAPAPESVTAHYNHLKALTGLIHLSAHSEADLITLLRSKRKCGESLNSLADLAERKSLIVWAHDNWESLDRELTRLKNGRGL